MNHDENRAHLQARYENLTGEPADDPFWIESEVIDPERSKLDKTLDWVKEHPKVAAVIAVACIGVGMLASSGTAEEGVCLESGKGCASVETQTTLPKTTTTTTATTSTVSPTALRDLALATAKSEYPILSMVEDDTLLRVGEVFCDGFDAGVSFEDLSVAFLTGMGPEVYNVDGIPEALGYLVGALVAVDCPEHSGKVS